MVDARTVDRRRGAADLEWRRAQVPSSYTPGESALRELLAWRIRHPRHIRDEPPKFISGFSWNPPYPAPIHTTLPMPWKIMGRDILVVADEDAQKRAPLPPAFLWIVDITDETHPVPISTYVFRRARALTLNLKSVAISLRNRFTIIPSTSPGSAAVCAPWIFPTHTVPKKWATTFPSPGKANRR